MDGLSYKVDELGDSVSINVDIGVFDKVAIFKAAYWFTEKYYLYLSSDANPDNVIVEIRSKSESDCSSLEAAAREFCNSVLDHQVRQHVIAETGEIREALIKRAFGEGKKHLDPDLLSSNESSIATADQKFEDDPLNVNRLTGAD